MDDNDEMTSEEIEASKADHWQDQAVDREAFAREAQAAEDDAWLGGKWAA